MKLKSIMILLICAVITVLVSACNTHEHNYSSYALVTNPTETNVGSANASCECGESTTIEVPALSNEEVWTLKSTTNSTCTVAGSKVYESIYGSVTVTLDLLPHEYASYELVVNPTLEEVGSAKVLCACGADKTVEVPALSNEEVWTLKSTTESTCTVAGSKIYESIYGSVTVTLGLLPHEYNTYSLVTNPTLDTVGSATATCACGADTTVEVPALSNEEVWNMTLVAADYNKAGSKTYTSVYGQVIVSVAKLVAPYDGKSYVSLNIEPAVDGVYKNGVITPGDTWSTHTITFDENGRGQGSAYPFRGYFEISMVDPTTGKIVIVKYDLKSSGETDADGNTIYVKDLESTPKTFNAYVDMETGIIVCEAEQFAEINLMVPFESIKRSDVKASAWTNSLAMTYTDLNGVEHNIYVYKGISYFDVKFLDREGNELTGDACFNSSLVNIKDDSNVVIEVFAFNGEKLVVADGLQGSYTNGEDTIIVSGAGIATFNGMEATYVINSDSNIGVYTSDSYYEVTLNKESNTFESIKPMVTIDFNTSDKVVVDGVSVNKNMAYVLPIPACETHAFKGWFYDSACTMAVEATFIPTENTTLYASWKEKVVITLVGVLEGDSTTLYLGEGDIIGEFLPVYGVEHTIGKKFIGWFLDEGFEISLPEEAEVTAEDTGIVIYACWEDVPAYYGTYFGANTFGDGNTRTTNTTLSIDENGTISGKWTGVVNSYDPTTGIISWHKTNEDTVRYFWFDPIHGVIVTSYGSQQNIGGDFFTFSRNCTSGSKDMVDRRLASSPEVRLISVLADDKTPVLVLVYNENLYSNISIEGTTGLLTTIDEVKNDSRVIIKDKDGNVIVGVAAADRDFSKSTTNLVLDKYYGAYSNGSEEISLDGRGGVVYGELIGTYSAALEGSAYQLDVYLNNKTEYYELTIDGTSFAMTKPMVTITFVTGEGHSIVESQSFNKNIVANLPILNEDGYVFNGWFVDAEFTEEATNYIPTSDVTLYAKFSAPVTLTINYCDDITGANIITYSFGDVATVDNPIRDGYVFDGWYTSSTYEENTLWTSGSVLETSVVIYAKWKNAPKYVGTYYGAEVYGSDEGSVSANKYLTIDAAFNMTSSRSSGTILPDSYDPETGILKYAYDSYYGMEEHMLLFVQYNGLDIIIMNWTGSKTDPVSNDIFIFVKGATSCTYDSVADENGHKNQAAWNSKNERVVTLTFDFGNVTFYVDSNTNEVYGNVNVKDASGNVLKAGAILDANVRLFTIYDENNEVIRVYGKDDNNKIVGLDGFQGTYTNGLDTLVVDGVKNVKLNDVTGTYNIVSDSTYTLEVFANESYYEVTLDQTTMTYTINKPMVEFVFDTNGGTIDGELTVSVNKNIEITLPTPVKEGFVFKGWMVNETVVSNNYVPTVDTMFVAKWSGSVNVTFVMNNGSENVVLSVETGTAATIEKPVYEGYTFAGWFLDEALSEAYNNEAITETTTFYAKWMLTPKFVDSYKGVEVWGSSGTGSESDNKTASINETFYLNGGKSGQIDASSYNPLTGIFTYSSSNYLGLFITNSNYKFLFLNYSQSSDDVIKGTDYYFYVNATTTSFVTQYIWNSGCERIVELTVDGNPMLFYINSNENLFMPCVAIKTLLGESLNTSDLANASSLVITFEGNVIKQYAKEGSNFVELDGFQGTYSGELGTVTLDGAGTAIVDGVNGTYKVVDSVIEITFNSITKTVTVSDNAYTCVLDATAGTYTYNGNVFVSAGDGNCTFNGVSGTYTKDGMNVTYTVSGNASTILLNSDGTYSEKSIFAGLTFTGSYYGEWDEYYNSLRVVFDDSTTISGVIYSGSGTSYYFNFTGELVGTTLTLTITSAVDRGLVGKTVVFEINGSTMTVSADSTINSNVYTFKNNGSVSCDGFSL